ncbi:MAG: serine/threonine-protein kinase [Nannocystaceae bacterium]
MSDQRSNEDGDARETSELRRRAFVRRTSGESDPQPAAPPTIDSEELMIVGLIAESRRARVLHGYDTRRRRHVAIKEIFGPLSDIAQARFAREAALPSQLRHPGIVEIVGTGRWPEGNHFYVMRMIHGHELSHLLDQTRALRERLMLLRHVTAIADAMAHAHRRRIIHRDLKPENIMISARGQAVIIDWGIAKDLGAAEDSPSPEDSLTSDPLRTHDGQIIGTPAYMPPEQARGERVDARADVYAIGAILLHVLTGQPPYPGDNAQKIVEQVLAGPPRSLDRVPSTIRPELVEVARRAMAHDPDERYRDSNDLALALHRLAV